MGIVISVMVVMTRVKLCCWQTFEADFSHDGEYSESDLGVDEIIFSTTFEGQLSVDGLL